MGSNLVGRSYPGKTLEQAKKQWSKDREEDRYENGNSYSGSIGMLDDGKVTSLVFNSTEDFDSYLDEKSKGDAYWAQVRVIRETEPLKKAKLALFYANRDVQTVDGGRLYEHGTTFKFETVKPTPALKKRLQAKLDKAAAKYKVLFGMQVEKSKKTTWMVGGWASS